MSGHLYGINHSHWAAKGSKKDKKGKISDFFALFVLFASTYHSL